VHHLARTAEILETFSVPVIGYGTDTFPTFYLRAGTYPVPARADSPSQLAKMLAVHWEMDGAGVVVAQPTPPEAALSPDILVPALQWVENQAASDMVGRRDLSPILMDKLNRLTGGKAVQAYQTILVANTRLAAQTARELNVLVAKAS
jgi:pseudouridine-5'-phosphate glycosidase